jgi:hypothetical protein
MISILFYGKNVITTNYNLLVNTLDQTTTIRTKYFLNNNCSFCNKHLGSKYKKCTLFYTKKHERVKKCNYLLSCNKCYVMKLNNTHDVFINKLSYNNAKNINQYIEEIGKNNFKFYDNEEYLHNIINIQKGMFNLYNIINK